MKSDESVVTIDLVTLVAHFIKIRSQFIRKRVSALQTLIDAELTFYELFRAAKVEILELGHLLVFLN